MTYKTLNKQISYPLSGSFTGSLAGTSSYALTALTASYFSGSISNAVSSSYALTASYALNGGSGGNSSQINTGSIIASVDVINNLFLIKSGSNN